MRFIGNKTDMLPYIEDVIKTHVKDGSSSLIDLFAGTGVVGEYFKKRFRILSNDTLYLSYSLIYAKIKNNAVPRFALLQKEGICDPVDYLNTAECSIDEDSFITYNYSPYMGNSRMYFTVDNAKRIDFIRRTIGQWKTSNLINDDEFFYLLSCLLEAVSSVSNTTGTYGAYLKHWDPRALKNIALLHQPIINNNQHNQVFQEDANMLVRRITGDICYIDPPYNNRQYLSNYHLLETIAKYDNPEIAGITGIRETAKHNPSLYSRKNSAYGILDDLLGNIKARHLIVSYSSDGILSKDELEVLLKKHGIPTTFQRYDIPYVRYQSRKVSDSYLREYLFYIQKDFPLEDNVRKSEPTINVVSSTKELLASPMNYIGGKYKLLTQLLPLFPKNINTFVDLFAGGYNVGININANQIIANDVNRYVMEILQTFKETPVNEILESIDRVIAQYGLSKTNKEGFLALRRDYNKNPSPLKLYVLVCHSFNYQFRFNNSHEYNNPFGKNRSHFSSTLRTKLIKFVQRLKEQTVDFMAKDFDMVTRLPLGKNDFVYCDPPYLITTGSYNDGNRGFKDWTIEQERKLYSVLDTLNKRGIYFALSNVVEHKGEENTLLREWKRQYNTYCLANNYSNSSHNTSRGSSSEVLITNY